VISGDFGRKPVITASFRFNPMDQYLQSVVILINISLSTPDDLIIGHDGRLSRQKRRLLKGPTYSSFQPIKAFVLPLERNRKERT
jgi:hypothetical protein